MIFQHNQPFVWSEGNNVTVKGEVLNMKNISRSYSGDYVCNADNGVGRWPVTQIISLDVLCKFQSKLNTVSYFDIDGIKYNDIDFFEK